jgi:hypothetical protein
MAEDGQKRKTRFTVVAVVDMAASLQGVRLDNLLSDCYRLSSRYCV